MRTRNWEDEALAELLKNKSDKKRWEINSSGYCMVEAWDFALKLATGTKRDGDYMSLLQKAVRELRNNPDMYHLVGDYNSELDLYEAFGDYTTGAIDYLPFALVNVTKVKCTIVQVTKDGKDCSITLYPFNHDIETDFNGPEIHLVFSRLRRHYDVAVHSDFEPDSIAKRLMDEG
jgi:hypothetical protein